MEAGHLLRHASRAFRAAPLALVATFTLLSALGVQAGLLGLPLLLIVASWYCKYAFVLLEATALGREPPVLSIEAANPLGETRPLALLAFAAVAVGVAGVAGAMLGPPARAAVAALGVLALPAAAAVLAVEGDWPRAFAPTALSRVARGLGASYLVVVAGGLVAAAGLAWLAPRVPPVATIALGQFAGLALAALLGGALYERRFELGIEAWESPERASARDARDAAAADAAAVDGIYTLVRARRLDAAAAAADDWLAAGGRTPERLAWLRDRAAPWEDRRIADRLTRELVGRLLALGRTGDALLEVERWWRRGGRYVPATGRELVRLAGLAHELRREATAARLLDECGPLLAADPEVRALLARRASDTASS